MRPNRGVTNIERNVTVNRNVLNGRELASGSISSQGFNQIKVI